MEIRYKSVFNQSMPTGPTQSSGSSASSESSATGSAPSGSSSTGSASSSSSSSSGAGTSVRNSTSSNSSSAISNQTFTDPNTEFSNFLKLALGGESKAQVSEEELYAGIIFQKLQAKSEQIGTAFTDEKAKIIDSLRRPDGVYSHEELAVQALQSIVSSGVITQEEAEKINGEAFSAAQLDSNLDTLFDDRGSESDPTMAVAALNEALTKAQTVMDGIAAGTVNAASRGLSGGPSSSGSGSLSIVSGANAGQISEQSMDGGGGFVWKPKSDSDGKLVVLLPAVYAGMIQRVEVHTALPPSEDTKVEEGDYKYDSNGGRPTYRFDKPGSDYGDNLYAVAYKNDGEILTWAIKDGGQRYD